MTGRCRRWCARWWLLCGAWATGLCAQAEALEPNLAATFGEIVPVVMPDDPSAPEPAPLVASEVGLASWYGAPFHRRRTASGERFDMWALTAAHPSLPFGSRVCVHSQVTGRTVVVRINDRGPHTRLPAVDNPRKRVIDLSRAAAEALGMAGLGFRMVQLFALEGDGQDCPARSENPAGLSSPR